MPTRNPKARRNIKRIDQNHTHCWLVQRVYNKELHSQTFTDAMYGGKAKALREAKQYRDNLEKTIAPFGSKVSSTGHAKVNRIRRTAKGPNKNNRRSTMCGVSYQPASDSWKSQYLLDMNATPIRKSFSVQKYGDEEAERLARKHRAHGDKLIAKQNKDGRYLNRGL